MKDSEWVTHLKGLNSGKTLRKLTTNFADPQLGLHHHPTTVAREKLKSAWSSIYIPDPLEIEIMLEMVQMALAHAEEWYPDAKTFLSNIYTEKVEIPSAVPCCLMGLSGVGKSALREALRRAFAPPKKLIVASEDHGEFPWHPIRFASARFARTLKEILFALLGGEYPHTNIVKGTGIRLYQSGACLNVLDEMQFLTTGLTSRAMVSNVLLTIAGLGIPMLYICNYSLVHKLLKTPNEIRQILLPRLRLLSPSLPHSDEWVSYLQALQSSAPEIFDFDLVAHKIPLWNLTAGLKRNLQGLLQEAYIYARGRQAKKISWAMIDPVYRSDQYFSARNEISALISYAASGKRISSDLICPFDAEVDGAYKSTLSLGQRANFHIAVNNAVLTNEEKIALNRIKAEAEPKQSISASEPLPAGPKPEPTPETAKSLVAAANALLNKK